MMTPTIGRVVHLHLNGARPKTWNGQNVVQLPAADHFVALVCYVHPRKPEGEHEINVAAFDHFGQTFSVNGIALVGPGVQMPANGTPFARWMPYQVQKATRGDHNSESAEPRPVPLPETKTAGELAREELRDPPRRCVMIEPATGQQCDRMGTVYSRNCSGMICEHHAAQRDAPAGAAAPQLVPNDQPEGEDAPSPT